MNAQDGLLAHIPVVPHLLNKKTSRPRLAKKDHTYIRLSSTSNRHGQTMLLSPQTQDGKASRHGRIRVNRQTTVNRSRCRGFEFVGGNAWRRPMERPSRLQIAYRRTMRVPAFDGDVGKNNLWDSQLHCRHGQFRACQLLSSHWPGSQCSVFWPSGWTHRSSKNQGTSFNEQTAHKSRYLVCYHADQPPKCAHHHLPCEATW